MTIILNRRDAAYVRSVLGSIPPGFDVLDDQYVEVVVYPQTIERCRRAAELANAPQCGYSWSTAQKPGVWHTGHTCQEERNHGGSHVCSCGETK